MTGIMQMLFGGGGRKAVSLTVSSPTYNYNIKTAVGANYVAGSTDVTLTISSVIGSTSTGSYGLDTGSGWATGDTIKIINNGYIMGCGGAAGGPMASGGGGGPAMIIRWPVEITNASGYISGGGGGGGGGAGITPYSFMYGGAGCGYNGYSYVNGRGQVGGAGAGGAGGGGFGAGGAIGPNGAWFTFWEWSNVYWDFSPGYGGGGGGGGASGGRGGYVPACCGQWAVTNYGGGGSGGLGIKTLGNSISWVSGSSRVYGGTAV